VGLKGRALQRIYRRGLRAHQVFSHQQFIQECSSLDPIRSVHQSALEVIEFGSGGLFALRKLALLRSGPPKRIGDGAAACRFDYSESIDCVTQLGGQTEIALVGIGRQVTIDNEKVCIGLD
jgi:hypothetical protein